MYFKIWNPKKLRFGSFEEMEVKFKRPDEVEPERTKLEERSYRSCFRKEETR
jgi:hypothetical protein